MRKFSKKIAFKLLNKLSELVYVIREIHLAKFNDWLDYQTSRYDPNREDYKDSKELDDELDRLFKKLDFREQKATL